MIWINGLYTDDVIKRGQRLFFRRFGISGTAIPQSARVARDGACAAVGQTLAATAYGAELAPQQSSKQQSSNTVLSSPTC
jgi:hypothetical protein